MKSIAYAGALLFIATTSHAASLDCGVVTIKRILAGPKNGSMMQVSNVVCGSSGWVCLDPNAEVMTQEESRRLYTFAMMHYLSGSPFRLSVYTDQTASSCNQLVAFPVVEDMRTP